MEYKELSKVNSEIKTTSIKGKEYAEVPERINAFRKLYPEGTIETEIVSCSGGVCIIKATISVDGKVLATGHAYEKEGSTFINKTSYIENCETSAVGRALGIIGIIGGSSIASYEEVANAKLNQNGSKPVKPMGASGGAQGAQDTVNRIRELAEKLQIPEANICEQAKVTRIEDMHPEQMSYCITWLEGML